MTTRVEQALRKWAEQLADAHKRFAEDTHRSLHKAIAYCGCHVACDYRCVVGLYRREGVEGLQ